jgi:hypothetical protein
LVSRSQSDSDSKTFREKITKNQVLDCQLDDCFVENKRLWVEMRAEADEVVEDVESAIDWNSIAFVEAPELLNENRFIGAQIKPL